MLYRIRVLWSNDFGGEELHVLCFLLGVSQSTLAFWRLYISYRKENYLFLFGWLFLKPICSWSWLSWLRLPFLFFQNTQYTLHILMFCRTWFGEYRNETLFLIMYYQGFISSKELVPLFYLVKPASIPYLHARRVQTDSGIRVVSGEKG